MGVKCLAQEHNTVRRLGLDLGPFFNPESSALTIRPPRLPYFEQPGPDKSLSNRYMLPKHNTVKPGFLLSF